MAGNVSAEQRQAIVAAAHARLTAPTSVSCLNKFRSTLNDLRSKDNAAAAAKGQRPSASMTTSPDQLREDYTFPNLGATATSRYVNTSLVSEITDRDGNRFSVKPDGSCYYSGVESGHTTQLTQPKHFGLDFFP